MGKKDGAKAAKDGEGPGAIGVWTQRARGVGLLIGFAVAFWVSRREGLPMSDAALRGVLGALAMSVVCWWCALLVITALIRSALHRQNEAHADAARRVADAQTAATVDSFDDASLS